MTVLILGATSPIARAIAREYAMRGNPGALAARDVAEVARHASDITIRYGVKARGYAFDALEYDRHRETVAEAARDLGPIEVGVIAFGDLGDWQRSVTDPTAARAVLETNFVGAASTAEALAQHMAPRRSGTIVGLSSVAGERGRYSNYFYGSSKGAFSLYLQGLRARLYHEGVHVLTVKPGLIDTPMTWGLRRGRIPIASPESLARAITRGVERRRDVIYHPWFWKWVMGLLRAVPESRWKRIKI